uniref:Ribonuclease H-like domain-containing protein n=1 Tax=Tanacetum cinerariifolium TaxID=118510 RepID=A0A699H4Y1_TANCI|nr:ribonuclease H-like domain-containing protein [Tanacetum cinerariifolium]
MDQPKFDEHRAHSGSDSCIHQPGNDFLNIATPIDNNRHFEGNVGTSEQVPRLNRYANHTFLDAESSCFISNLNTSSEPSSFEEASKDPNWISAINDEMNALYENGTWILADLLFGRKPIGNISYDVHCLSHYMHAPLKSHLDIALRLLKYLKLTPGNVTRRSVSGYCIFINGCLVSWISKKQATMSKSSAEVEYRSMAAATCKIIWIVKVMKDLNVDNLLLVELHCNNKFAMQIAANPVMHEKTNHFDLYVLLDTSNDKNSKEDIGNKGMNVDEVCLDQNGLEIGEIDEVLDRESAEKEQVHVQNEDTRNDDVISEDNRRKREVYETEENLGGNGTKTWEIKEQLEMESDSKKQG